MKQFGLLQFDAEYDYFFVEYGAGKAGLSQFISRALPQQDNINFLVIDREARRKKKDKEMKQLGFKTYREKMDIADFNLCKFLAQTSNKAIRVLGVAKHLCGGATDLALTSYKQLDADQLSGIAIATCCHNMCDIKTYVNLEFIRNEINQYFSETESLLTHTNF